MLYQVKADIHESSIHDEQVVSNLVLLHILFFEKEKKLKKNLKNNKFLLDSYNMM